MIHNNIFINYITLYQLIYVIKNPVIVDSSQKEFKNFGCPKKHKSKKAIAQHKLKYATPDLTLLNNFDINGS